MTDKLLPENHNDALDKMIELACECVNVLQAENDRITINDMLKFVVAAEDKERVFGYYAQASAEFRARIDDMQGQVDDAKVTQLQQLQLQINDMAAANNERLAAIDARITEGKET